jgi:hypothetical protein
LFDILKLWFNVFGTVFSTSEIHESLVGFFWAILFEKPARTMGLVNFKWTRGIGSNLRIWDKWQTNAEKYGGDELNGN